jgi:hypothetical protein
MFFTWKVLEFWSCWLDPFECFHGCILELLFLYMGHSWLHSPVWLGIGFLYLAHAESMRNESVGVCSYRWVSWWVFWVKTGWDFTYILSWQEVRQNVYSNIIFFFSQWGPNILNFDHLALTQTTRSLTLLRLEFHSTLSQFTYNLSQIWMNQQGEVEFCG